MADSGTAHEGVDNVLINAYTGLKLILYTNGFQAFDRDSVLADFTEPDSVDSESDPNGYAPVLLNGTWSSLQSVITHVPDVTFTNTGNSEAWNIVYGAAMVTATHVLHWKDFANEYALDVGQSLVVDLSSMVT